MTKKIEHEILELLKPLDIFSKLEILEKMSVEINNEEISDARRFIIQSKFKIRHILNLCFDYVNNNYSRKMLSFNISIKTPEVWLDFLDNLNQAHNNFYGVDYNELSSAIDDALRDLVYWDWVAENILSEFGLCIASVHLDGKLAFDELGYSIEDCVFKQEGKIRKPIEMVSSILSSISTELDGLEDTIDIVLNNIKNPNSATKNALKEANSIQSRKLKGEEFSSSHELFKDVIYPAWIEQRLK